MDCHTCEFDVNSIAILCEDFKRCAFFKEVAMITGGEHWIVPVKFLGEHCCLFDYFWCKLFVCKETLRRNQEFEL